MEIHESGEYVVIDSEAEAKEKAKNDSIPRSSNFKNDKNNENFEQLGSTSNKSWKPQKTKEPRVNAESFILQQKRAVCPQVNCPEKIIICLDLSSEMESTFLRSKSGEKNSALDVAKRALRMFILHKNGMDSRTEFALWIVVNECTVVHEFTRKAQNILKTLADIEPLSIDMEDPITMNTAHLFQTVESTIDLPTVEGDIAVTPPPYIFRLLLVYGRSQGPPVGLKSEAERRLEACPYFFTDVLYIHEPVSDLNKCEAIFHSLCTLDHGLMSYIFEESRLTAVLNSMAKLLAHPLQRPPQLQGYYKIGDSPSPAQIDDAALL